MKTLTYNKTGVNYQLMDFFKVLAQEAGVRTTPNLKLYGMRELRESRGESAYVIKRGGNYLAFVIEGLGTKNLVADKMRAITGKTYYDSIARDTVAMIINDLIVVGARPVVISAYWAVGSSDWFKDKKRVRDLINGWRKACDDAQVTWGGGETPTLNDVVNKNVIDLAGSAFGIIEDKKRLVLGDRLEAGDDVVLFESSGIHANGLSLARKIAETLPQGYATKMKSGEMYGEALLTPTTIYARLIQELFRTGTDIHYMVNVTGHGWRKIMRSKKPFTYRISRVPPVPEVLQFIAERGPIEEKEAYGTLNMGVGFAVFVPKGDREKVLKVSRQLKIKAYVAGGVERGKKQVIIEQKGIIFNEDSLKLRISKRK